MRRTVQSIMGLVVPLGLVALSTTEAKAQGADPRLPRMLSLIHI